ncbi:MAG TPA: response regulator transcription factor [Gemmatimonadaceae bacterium]|jgi:DNA-binding response OmpR family regulator|nr:response regulator transcription factor [Gemmatimonadaceae bacterium]
MARILVVEDNLALAEGVAYNLRHEGHEVRIAEDGESGLAEARAWSPSLVILDLMLPRLDGYGVLSAIRADRNDVPVIILTARGEEADKVRGFRLDADQYVTKPFGVLELLERVGSLLRRSTSRAGGAAAAPHESIRFGDVVVDVDARTALRHGVPCALTPKAFELLLALVGRGGRVATRQELLKEVWGYGAFVLSRTVDSHIAELRRKLEEDPARPRHIVTVWKVGYRFEPS